MMRLVLCKTVIVLAVPLMLCTGCNRPSGPTTRGDIAVPSTSPLPPGSITYLALGDSTGSGVGASEAGGGYVARLFKRLLTQRPGSKLVNLCVSGATASDVLRGQLDFGVRHDPQLVTLGIGINDVGHGVRLEQFSQNYEKILARLRSNTRATIVVTNIPDISSAPRIPAAMRREYHQRIVEFNDALTAIASRHGVIVFDVYSITHQELPSHPEYFSDDGFHPSDQGYELWAEKMWPTIAQLLGS
ncbi:MAG TPA: SGNH/GDSL hydrolase family protein [Pyrinomonadaceae bacterium]|nr:SGNH/GDSL hydrolase family protein [Pyrinomonadaceae bacterium]